MFKKALLTFFITCTFTAIYECNGGTRRKIPKVIILSDENSTLELDAQYFIDLSPDTFNDIPSLNAFPMEICPRNQEKDYVGRLPFMSANKEYNLHKAIENNQYQLSKFILQFHRPQMNLKRFDQTPLDRAIGKNNLEIMNLLLSQPDIIVDENHLKLAKEKFCRLDAGKKFIIRFC